MFICYLDMAFSILAVYEKLTKNIILFILILICILILYIYKYNYCS